MNPGFILRFLNYYILAGSRHSVHSPFVYELVNNVINDRKEEPVFHTIEEQRKLLLCNKNLIRTEDYGAGPSGIIYKERSIASIARTSAKPQRYCTLLHRLVKHFKPVNMLELGTSFGISALYQASGNTSGRLVTIEGNTASAQIAEETIKATGISNITVCRGNFTEILPDVLQNTNSLDYVFIDGNHRKEATLSYFGQCLEKSHQHTFFVFDDINWSDGMREAWQIIRSHKKTTVTIDLFMMGIVFLNSDLSKENFVIRY
jgi:predicted O-methyltransferase YrrM